jgi:hypothetical protein
MGLRALVLVLVMMLALMLVLVVLALVDLVGRSLIVPIVVRLVNVLIDQTIDNGSTKFISALDGLLLSVDVSCQSLLEIAQRRCVGFAWNDSLYKEREGG